METLVAENCRSNVARFQALGDYCPEGMFDKPKCSYDDDTWDLIQCHSADGVPDLKDNIKFLAKLEGMAATQDLHIVAVVSDPCRQELALRLVEMVQRGNNKQQVFG